VEYLGIDFSGNHASWRSRCTNSNVWICRVESEGNSVPQVLNFKPSNVYLANHRHSRDSLSYLQVSDLPQLQSMRRSRFRNAIYHPKAGLDY
jgi:hypothetical protein